MQLTFPSYGFVFFFLPVTLVIHRLLLRASGKDAAEGRSVRLDRLFLTAVSLLFYLTFGLRNFAVLVAQACMVYIFFLILKRLPMEKNKPAFVCTAACTIVFLAFFKYLSPFMPVAISFTTFTLLSFLTDTARGEIDACSFPDFLLYVFFFPKLLQGPIERYEDFRAGAEQAAKTPVSAERFAQALFYFVLGLSKKVLLADNLARPSDFAWSDPGSLLWMEAVLAIFAYSLHMYFDFSSYCDMGRAVAWMFGFELSRNFDHPYLAHNINDHWKRWHSTLSRFFVRYVYIPLGGNRKGMARALFNTLFIFALSGLWHGNGAGFLLWGLCHGLLACATKLLKKPLPVPAFLKIFATYLFITVAFVLFRAPDLHAAGIMYGKIFDKPWFVLHDRFIDTWLQNYLWYPLRILGVPNARTAGLICMWFLLGVALLLVFAVPNAEELSERFARRIARTGADAPAGPEQPAVTDGSSAAQPIGTVRRPAVFPSALAAAVLFVWCVLSFGEVGSFVYFNF